MFETKYQPEVRKLNEAFLEIIKAFVKEPSARSLMKVLIHKNNNTCFLWYRGSDSGFNNFSDRRDCCSECPLVIPGKWDDGQECYLNKLRQQRNPDANIIYEDKEFVATVLFGLIQILGAYNIKVEEK